MEAYMHLINVEWMNEWKYERERGKEKERNIKEEKNSTNSTDNKYQGVSG